MANIPILTVDKLARSFGAFDVFKDITFQVAEKQHVALVGVNGAGKSTILRIIAGVDEATGGTVTPLPGLRITYLPQEARFESDRTVREEAREAFADVLRAADRMREIEAEMADAGDDRLDALMAEYDRLQQRFESGNGYDVEFRTDEVLLGLGFRTDQFDERVSLLSGGQKTRVALAKALLASPDLLLLDEPTNHLDLEMLGWLEGFLARWGGACLIVSHDRYFLDRVTTRTLDLSFGVLEDYPAAYHKYVDLKKERMARRLIEYQEQQEFIARTEEFIRKYKAGQRSREARGRQTRLDRLERIERPRENDTITLKIPVGVRSGQNVMTVDRVTAGYAGTDLTDGVVDPGVGTGDAPTALNRMLGTTRDAADRPRSAGNGHAAPLADDAPRKILVQTGELLIERGDRIGLIGPNGSGKTTLLRTLVGILPTLKGRIQIGANVRIGYYAQTHEQLHHDGTPLSVIVDAQPMSEEAARTYLGRFLFSNDDVYKRVGALSGGERSRLALAVLLLQQANLLVLDEPTNHLDIHARETLEEMLRDFDGTLLFVSHDRYFIDRVASRIWDIQEGRVRAFLGNYTDHQRAIGALAETTTSGATNAPPAAPTAAAPAPQNSNGDGTGKATANGVPAVSGTSPQAQARRMDNRTARDAQRKLTAAEKDISRLEARLNDLSEAMATAGVDSDGEAIQRLSQEYAKSQSELEDAYARWEDATAAMEPVA